MKIRSDLILVMMIIIALTMNQTYVDSFIEEGNDNRTKLDDSRNYDLGDVSLETEDTSKRTEEEKGIENIKHIDTFGEEKYTNFDEVVEDFNPEVNIQGQFSSQVQQGEIQGGEFYVDLPGEGDYEIEGNVSNLQAQYIQNPSAETSEMFYSDTAVQAGLNLERLNEDRSIDGDYVWKFYSQNIDSMAYSLYQEDFPLYNNNTEISYSYLLESNSSLQYVVNSSLIVDLVFDTCRVMIIHWHYTNLEPPLYGENTTIPFVVYRLLQNTSWDDQWHNYSLSIYDLFDKNDPYIPQMLKSAGIYALSPEESECSVLIDNFRVITSAEPEDINLEINGNSVNTIGVGNGDFNFWEYVNASNYLISWNYNSSYTITGEYSLSIEGEITIEGERDIILMDENYVLYRTTVRNLSSTIEFVNITYPNFWELKDNITGCNILLNENITLTLARISLERIDFETDIIIEFKITNSIQSIGFSETTIFEQINGTIDLKHNIINPSVHIFWFGSTSGSRTIEVEENRLLFTFPSFLIAEQLDVCFIINEDNYFGYANETLILTRNPSEIITIDSLELPIYSLKTIDIDYLNIITEDNILDGEVFGHINNEIVYAQFLENNYKLSISALYLEVGNSSMEIFAQSNSYATASKKVNLTILEGELDIGFQYEKLEETQHYNLQFNITSNLIPVGFAPLIVNINNESTISGVTDETGFYNYEIVIIPTVAEYTISLTLIKAQNILLTKNFIIEFNNLQANIERTQEDVIIAENITLIYNINYPTANSNWFVSLNQEMLPIFDAYIETENLRIPVIWDQNTIYWDYSADNNTLDHKLIVQTTGPKTHVITEEEGDVITLYITIDSGSKMFSKLSFIYYINNTYTTSKYEWKLFSNKINEVTNDHNLEINDLYIYFTNIDLIQGSILVLDLIGIKTSNTNVFTNIVLPVLSSSGVTLGAITTAIKIYNKRKGMVLEI